ncbi:hypothetical protein EIP86_000571 [Pleurotus ostreatoroseus]|nr:hypothetical protein EIP86_000571 [Pleurotus ostreatoroseus]
MIFSSIPQSLAINARPECDSLADGEKRRQREEGKKCECKDGWGGVNCNVCKTDAACANFPLRRLPGEELSMLDDEDLPIGNMTCYTGGDTVIENHQICNVTNRKILDMLPDRPPEVTFSCDKLDNITDFLKTMITGPASFSCKTGQGCKFEEPGMNDLILTFFGDSSISLECDSGECLHYSQVPGYVTPAPPPDSKRFIALSAAGVIIVFVVISTGLWYASRTRSGDFGGIRLPEYESARLMTEHVPATLHFSGISYSLGNHKILDDISGSVKPGQLMAIMGASGAGKSTFLDILARKRKRGVASGRMLVNGRDVPNAQFKKVMGFVDQEDTLMSTLTVYETVLYSALLRLPREMSLEAKKFRTLETLHELGILGIKDMFIGSSTRRSISGGEKRRVSIACELVTSPSILFLDEPTSGLDAYNALSVMDSLVTLARDYNRTVVFTIHQPRSNIVSLFDKLILLAHGKLIYSGDTAKCYDYLQSINHPCPPGFNIADFAIDMTMLAGMEPKSLDSPATDAAISDGEQEHREGEDRPDEEQALSAHSTPFSIPVHARNSSSGDETEGQTRSSTVVGSSTNFIKRKTSQLLEAIKPSSQFADKPITPQLAELVDAFARSEIAVQLKADIDAAAAHAQDESALPDVALENDLTRGRQRASWGTQFRILSGRAFKNLYRDPALLAAHYVSAIVLALICGSFYYHVQNDMGGIQNRLGVFFFTLALFGFSCLSSLGLFSGERVLFMRERANGYYAPLTYFASKILFDILPLRVIPPMVYGAIMYGFVGLVPEVATFWKFMLVLVMFNLTTASVILLLSIAFASTSIASLVGTLIMLFNLLFTGLLINRDAIAPWFKWMYNLSFFHAAYEALTVNELRYLTLKERRAFWWPDIASLGIFFGVFTITSFLILQFYVKEQR